MASTTQAINTDPIFLESVAVETPAALKTTEENSGELKANEPTEVPKHFGTTAAQNGDAVLVDRSFSPPNNERVINNSLDLLALVDQPDIDVCVEVSRRRQELYVTTHPFSDTDVQNTSWLFTIGRLDGWTDRLTSFYIVNTPLREYVPLPYLEKNDVPIVRLGAALRVLQEESLSKVKYVIGVQSKSSPASHKLLVSHSRKAAAVDIFYEVLNGNSIVFVGAILKNAVIPVEHPHKQPAIKFMRVDSIKEAENVGDGVVGIIC